ncbi:MAG: hypothetical protein JWM12_2788 [Ilumatobacteraceae bacterium]|nr:hypothetical protein [Ilumatobacteraceae bacterium]
MTIASDDHTSTTPPTSSSGSGARAGEVARTAANEASSVAGGAVDAGREVANHATEEIKAVASQAKDHAQQLVDQTKSELVGQAEAKSQQAAGGLRTLSSQLGALGDGRPQDAGPLGHYLEDAQSKVASIADRLERGGPQGLLDDVTAFARRKPGVFLVGAVGAGFVVGRLVRAGALGSRQSSGGSPSGLTPPMSTASTTGPWTGGAMPPPSISPDPVVPAGLNAPTSVVVAVVDEELLP